MVPSLEELGHDVSSLGTVFYPGGETEALRRMEESIKKTVGYLLKIQSNAFRHCGTEKFKCSSLESIEVIFIYILELDLYIWKAANITQ